MSVLINDYGFQQVMDAPERVVPADCRPDAIEFEGVRLLAIEFPNFADGRALSIARALRRRGYDGRLRALGHVISDQYAMVRRVGFDEVEISDEHALRQPEEEWLSRADWRAHSYQQRLSKGV